MGDPSVPSLWDNLEVGLLCLEGSTGEEGVVLIVAVGGGGGFVTSEAETGTGSG